ncbi:MAG: ABC transporter permease subunit [Clostridia bacterium]|nr:ABC transporter permease subunit [Clostridia bacterium]
MMRSIMQDKVKRAIRGVAVAVFWIGVWWLIAALVRQELLIPSPLVALNTLLTLLPTSLFWQSVGMSLLRIVLGFLAALIGGAALAVVTSRFSLIRALVAPLLHIIRAAPVASFIILTLVWIDYDVIPAFIAFLMVLPIVWVNVEEGIRRTDKGLLEMTKLYAVSPRRVLTRVYLPSIKPYFLTAAVNGLGFAWKSGVAAEIICRPDLAIGNRLQLAKMTLETPEVFAWTAVVIVLSILLEKLLLCMTRKEGAHGKT